MRHVPKLLLTVLKKKKPAIALDIGVGKGYLPSQLHKHNLLTDYYGIDIIRQSKYCNEQIDILNFETPGRYPLIICDQVIEHIYDQSQALKKIHNLLTPDGVLFIGSIISCPWSWYFYDGYVCAEHVREYKSLGEFEYLLKSHEFEIIHIHQRQFFLKFYIPVPGYFIVEALCRRK